MVYLVDSQSRAIQAVLEPDNFTRDVPLLLDALLAACSHKRRQLTQQAIQANDIPALRHILAYHTLAEAVLQDVHFSSHGTPLHYVIQTPASLSCLPHVVDRDALAACPNAQGLLPVHTAVLLAGPDGAEEGVGLSVLQRLVEVAAWPCDQGGGGMSPEVLVNLRTTAPHSCLTDTDKDTIAEAVDRTPLHLSTDEEVGVYR